MEAEPAMAGRATAALLVGFIHFSDGLCPIPPEPQQTLFNQGILTISSPVQVFNCTNLLENGNATS